MARKRDTLKLGITVSLMFILFVAGLIFIGGVGVFKPKSTVLVVRFYSGVSMPQISEGSLVTYFGQRVGEVVESEIIEDVDPQNTQIKDQQFLEIRANIPASLELREDCKIIATGPPLGGKGQLDIVSRGTSEKPVNTEQAIYGSVSGFQAIIDQVSRELNSQDPESLLASIKLQLDPQDPNSVMLKIHQSIDDINRMTAVVAHELDRKHEDVFLAKLHVSLDKLHVGLREIVSLIQENRPKVDSTLTSINQASTKFDQDVMTVLANELKLEESRGVSLLTKVHDSFDYLNMSLADISVVSSNTKEVVVLNKDRIDLIVQNATDASAHLKQGIKDLKLHPWKILFPPSDAEKNQLHLFNVAREFSEAAAHLDDTTGRLNALLLVREGQIPSNDPELAIIQANLSATIKRFNQAEQELFSKISNP